MVNTGDVFDGHVAVDVEFRVSEELHSKFRRSILRGGELLVTLVGANFGRVAIAPDRFAGYNCSRAVGVVPVMEDSVYVMYALRSPLSRHFMNIWANTTAQPTFNLKELGCLPVPIAPSESRAAIKTLLTALDDRIALLRETNATLEAIAQALFKSWFVDFDPVRAKQQGLAPAGMDEATAALFPDSFEESALRLVPKGWRTCSMADVSTVGIGKTPPRKESQWFSETPSDVRWVSIRDMGAAGAFAFNTSEYLTSEAIDRFNVRVVPDNTALLSFKMTIGRVAITDGEMTTNEAIAHFKLDVTSPVSTEYIYLSLRAFDFSRLSSTSSIADAVNSKTVRELPLVVPDTVVLRAFQDVVAPVFQRIKVIGKQAQTLATLRDTLLPRLISGQLRLPEDEALAA